MENETDVTARLGELAPAVDAALEEFRAKNIVHRLWARDHTVWKDDPADIRNRLGWLDSPSVMRRAVPDILSFAREARDAGFDHALLMGMGGSSLAPEMFRRSFGVKEGCLDLDVLDSTDPGAVLGYARERDPSRTLFIVSTKSGGTVETLSFMKYFYNHVSRALGPKKAGSRFIGITDPGSSLASTGADLGFRRVFLNDPDIGGRYSALSFFGLVPAALAGIHIRKLLESAGRSAAVCREPVDPATGRKHGAWLGAVIGQAARTGRDKLTLFLSPGISGFGAWVEQLIAESTGKEGKGILPVDGERPAPPETYAPDRLFVRVRLSGDATHDALLDRLAEQGHPVIDITLGDRYDLGGECFRWEVATAVAAHLLGINPFDQPNVESAKILARRMVAAFREEGRLPDDAPTLTAEGVRVTAAFPAESLSDVFNRFLGAARKGNGGGRSYIALQAYVRPGEDTWAALQVLRSALHRKTRLATTLGYGPRFLHSTGQLHKGDGGNGLFIQITADMPEDAPIPDRIGKEESSITFGALKTAQALGDRRALLDAGRPVVRFHVGEDAVTDIGKLTRALGD